MASLLAGAEWGAYPDVGSLTIAHRGYEGQLRYGRFFEEIEHDLDQSGSTDPVVVSASWGVCDAFKLPGGPDPPCRKSQPQADLYTRMKSLGDKYRVVYAVAIGNAGRYDEVRASIVLSNCLLLIPFSYRRFAYHIGGPRRMMIVFLYPRICHHSQHWHRNPTPESFQVLY